MILGGFLPPTGADTSASFPDRPADDLNRLLRTVTIMISFRYHAASVNDPLVAERKGRITGIYVPETLLNSGCPEINAGQVFRLRYRIPAESSGCDGTRLIKRPAG